MSEKLLFSPTEPPRYEQGRRDHSEDPWPDGDDDDGDSDRLPLHRGDDHLLPGAQDGVINNNNQFQQQRQQRRLAPSAQRRLARRTNGGSVRGGRDPPRRRDGGRPEKNVEDMGAAVDYHKIDADAYVTSTGGTSKPINKHSATHYASKTGSNVRRASEASGDGRGGGGGGGRGSDDRHGDNMAGRGESFTTQDKYRTTARGPNFLWNNSLSPTRIRTGREAGGGARAIGSGREQWRRHIAAGTQERVRYHSDMMAGGSVGGERGGNLWAEGRGEWETSGDVGEAGLYHVNEEGEGGREFAHERAVDGEAYRFRSFSEEVRMRTTSPTVLSPQVYFVGFAVGGTYRTGVLLLSKSTGVSNEN